MGIMQRAEHEAELARLQVTFSHLASNYEILQRPGNFRILLNR
jgi:hypothetical protein